MVGVTEASVGVTPVGAAVRAYVTSGENSLAVHLVMEAPDAALIPQVRSVAERHGIEHVTVQLETPAQHGEEAHGHGSW